MHTISRVSTYSNSPTYLN